MLLLEHKGIPYRQVQLPTGLHPMALRVLGFGGNKSSFRHIDGGRPRLLAAADRMGTVPTLRMDRDRWVSTNRAIARFLDELAPEPPLFPATGDRRQAVEDAECWGDELFQMAARRLVLAASLHGGDALVDRANDGRLGPLLFRGARTRLIGARLFAWSTFATTERAEQELLTTLPEMLDRIDAWIEAGVLNGEQLYAADFMIAPSLALLTYRPALRAELERRPLMRLIDRVLPEPSASA
jgi:glutathione S-transferase